MCSLFVLYWRHDDKPDNADDSYCVHIYPFLDLKQSRLVFRLVNDLFGLVAKGDDLGILRSIPRL